MIVNEKHLPPRSPWPQRGIDMRGMRFGKVEVTEFWGREASKYRLYLWLCQCDCGNQVVSRGDNLRSGNTTSCGCLHSGGRATERHGHHDSPTYSTWEHMIGRCYHPRNKKYPLYGGRGITVCSEWKNSFEAFLRDVGERPEGKSLDRFPNIDGNYEPSNVRWATVTEQNRNLRTATRVEFEGATIALTDLAERYGKNISTVKARLKRGMPLLEALTT